jgi:hypothetical protein
VHFSGSSGASKERLPHDVSQAATLVVSAQLPGSGDAHCGASGVFVVLGQTGVRPPPGSERPHCVIVSNQVVPLSSLWKSTRHQGWRRVDA